MESEPIILYNNKPLESFTKRSFLLSQFYFFYFFSTIFGFLFYLTWYQFLVKIELLSFLYRAFTLFSFISSIFVLYHALICRYVYRLLFVFLALISVCEVFSYYYLSIFHLKDIDFFQWIYMANSPELLNLYSPTPILYKKIFIFSKLILALASSYFLYKNGTLKPISSIYIKVMPKNWNLVATFVHCIYVFVLTLAIIYASSFFILFTLQKGLNLATRGFFTLDIKNNGQLNMRLLTHSKVYQKQMNHTTITVHLYPSVHIAPVSFYEEYDNDMPSNAVVLQEGVLDKQHKIGYSIRDNYKAVASELNFVVQGLIPSEPMAKKKNIFYQIADVDVSTFSNSTLKLLEFYFSEMNKNDSAADIMSKASSEVKIDIFTMKTFREDVIVKRNKAIFDSMDLVIEKTKFRTFVIPWGALHMRGVEEELIKRGYQKIAEKEHIFATSEQLNAITKYHQGVNKKETRPKGEK